MRPGRRRRWIPRWRPRFRRYRRPIPPPRRFWGVGCLLYVALGLVAIASLFSLLGW